MLGVTVGVTRSDSPSHPATSVRPPLPVLLMPAPTLRSPTANRLRLPAALKLKAEWVVMLPVPLKLALVATTTSVVGRSALMVSQSTKELA